jgi:hypothetical protein
VQVKHLTLISFPRQASASPTSRCSKTSLVARLAPFSLVSLPLASPRYRSLYPRSIDTPPPPTLSSSPPSYLPSGGSNSSSDLHAGPSLSQTAVTVIPACSTPGLLTTTLSCTADHWGCFEVESRGHRKEIQNRQYRTGTRLELASSRDRRPRTAQLRPSCRGGESPEENLIRKHARSGSRSQGCVKFCSLGTLARLWRHLERKSSC